MSEGGMDRRKFILGSAAAALTALPQQAETAEAGLRLMPSTLTQEMLAQQKEVAIKSLRESIPEDTRMEYLREHAKNLGEESQMYIPSPNEIQEVAAKGRASLGELVSKMQGGESGIFIFADADEKSGRMQRLYVIQKEKANQAQFVKAYRVSMSEAGFGNKKDSGQTPLGLHSIQSGKQGLFGEVVSGLNKHKDAFNHLKYKGQDHWFVKNFGERSANEANKDVAEVVTDQYLIEGPQTDTARGIRIHGTNRSGMRRPDGTWVSFLGGIRRSGGCIRMSNIDIRDLGLSNYIRMPGTPARGAENKRNTQVMIYATDKAKNLLHIPGDEYISRPPRWIPPPENSQPSSPTPEQPKSRKNLPPRWIPPA